MYIDNIKLLYSEDIGMEFGLGKYARLIMKRGKKQMTEEEEELPSQERNQSTPRKENYKCIWLLEADSIKQERWKKNKLKKEYLKKARKLLETNYISEISSKAWKIGL